MGSLIIEIPHSEVTATLEVLDHLGVTRDDLKRLRKSNHKKSEVAKLIKSNVIDCDADPYVPSDWKIEDHKKGGQFDFDPANVQFYQVDRQVNGKSIRGTELLEELFDKPVMNANVLDYLLANPDLIPEDWKTDERGETRYIFFPGTIYRDESGYLCVRNLCWNHGDWRSGNYWLINYWDSQLFTLLYSKLNTVL